MARLRFAGSPSMHMSVRRNFYGDIVTCNVLPCIVKVKAVDQDVGANGNVTYSLVKSSDQSSDRFDIDPVTGIVRTADVFDREAQIGVTDYGVTVKAEDQGSPTLAGFCTFRFELYCRIRVAEGNSKIRFVT
jgi:Cadherin domain